MDIIMIIALILVSWLAGVAIALVVYDVRERKKTINDLNDTLKKLRETHNHLSEQFQSVSDQVSKLEMSVGLKNMNR
jgi:chromosome segregation ATPase